MDNENSSIFQPYSQYDCWRGEKQIILKTSIGCQLPYIVNFKRNTVQIFNIEWERITHSYVFPEGCQLVDVDYFPTEDGKLGILVAVEDPRQSWGSENFVVALAAKEDQPMMTVTHSADIPTKITVIKTLFSCADMSRRANREVLKLYHRLMTWQHVVAIGCKDSQCHLARLTPVEDSASLVVPIHNDRRNLINLMSAFIEGSVLQYTQNDGSYRNYPTAAVYISALALMPRSRTLLVGLSMGGILAASLNPSNQMIFLELRHERLIRKIAPLEPEDDPDKFEYFIAAVDASPRHPVMIQLWRGSFKTLEQVEEDFKYDNPFYLTCLEHKIPFGEKWISVNPIVTEREHWVTTKRRAGHDESALNVSQTFGATSNRNSVLLTYERKKMLTSEDDPNGLPEYIVEGAIFDIDAWYYKRVPGKVSTDGTVLRQCPFLSTIKSNIPSEDVNDIGILAMNATDVSRFSSMISDADQLFYPSALTYERVFVAKNSKIEWMKIQNIQDTIINKCSSKLAFYLNSAEDVSGIIIAAGMVRKNILSGSPNSSAADINYSQLSSDQKVLLNLIVYYGKVEALCGIVSNSDVSETLKTEIADWALHEAVDFKRTISDKMVAIFQGRSHDLSPLAQDAITQGIKLFRVVYEYLKTCSKFLKSSRLHNMAHSMKCMRNHTKLIYQFFVFDIIPVNQERQKTMRDMHSKRKIAAIRNSSSLPIQALIRNMDRLAPNAQFWDGITHSEWYPPTPVDLLESLLCVNLPERMKRELVVQYVVDWVRASGNELNDKQIAMEVIKIMTNQMLEVDLEKIYYVLDQEKNALTDNKAAEEVRALGEKVFSMQREEVSYEKLWGGGVPITVTINKQDLKKFEQRMKLQMEKARLPVLDPESEMLYQVYLFENEKFNAMSSEAIRSNKLLSMFMPGMYKKHFRSLQKSSKEKEIEQTVKTMFERQKMLDEVVEDEDDMVAVVRDQQKRKRKSGTFGGDDDDCSSVSSASFVPPTAKKIQLWKKASEPAVASIPESPDNKNSSITSLVHSGDPHENNEINMLIATPARYYKRPAFEDDDVNEFLSPTRGKEPPLPAQNSILKTAKAVQTGNRGRIRFHESVRKPAEERIEKNEDSAPSKGLTLNFAILEDEEEEETMTTRRSRTMETEKEVEREEEVMEEEEEESHEEDVEQEKEEDECVESEKTFEEQEDFEVLEDTSAPEKMNSLEDTFEPREDDVMPPVDETYKEEEEKEEEEEKDKEEKQEESNGEEVSDGILRSMEVQSDDDVDPIQPEIVEEEVGEDVEKVQEHQEEVGKEEEEQKTEEVQENNDVVEEEKQEELHENPVSVKPKTSDAPVEASSEVQEPEDDRPPSRTTRTKTVQKTPSVKTNVDTEDGPPSTRLRTRSCSIKRDDVASETPRSRRTSVRRSASRTSSVSEQLETVVPSGKTRKSTGRAASVEHPTGSDVSGTPRRRGRPRLSSLTTTPKETRKRENSTEQDDTETPNKRRRGTSRATPMKVIPEDEPSISTANQQEATESSVVTPKKGRGRPRKELANVEEELEEPEEPAVNTSLRRSTRRSQQQ
ncbi:Protein CBR-MEL-28 [Caenorhabditis briggsae]|uniref:Protein CBR-MEL-28 n=1 Tax=Caenorhabditis briggsae TaxID=6238 RepID=A8XSR2_CAEBR|nr:Protein CBR-MEL-28 [Caenorhabditis briggsae]CAP35514.1 Protein CBR-MEL-28 [Caenorhabditis briggsae]